MIIFQTICTYLCAVLLIAQRMSIAESLRQIGQALREIRDRQPEAAAASAQPWGSRAGR